MPHDPLTYSVADALDQLRRHTAEVPLGLMVLTTDELTHKAPGKWSRQEILGHLIDSALNNLKRFTDAQFGAVPYLVQGYDQNRLVEVNQYQHLPLAHLVALWRSLNEQILYVAEAIPTETLDRPIRLSNPVESEKTIGWLIVDYVYHLEHHLKTLL